MRTKNHATREYLMKHQLNKNSTLQHVAVSWNDCSLANLPTKMLLLYKKSLTEYIHK